MLTEPSSAISKGNRLYPPIRALLYKALRVLAVLNALACVIGYGGPLFGLCMLDLMRIVHFTLPMGGQIASLWVATMIFLVPTLLLANTAFLVTLITMRLLFSARWQPLGSRSKELPLVPLSFTITATLFYVGSGLLIALAYLIVQMD